MPDEHFIDPTTGEYPFAEGLEVRVEDELGRPHEGIITSIQPGYEPLYNVLLNCRGRDRELLVPEARIVARVTFGFERND